MRKIALKHETSKKDRMKQFIVGGILIFIMFASVLGYAFGGGGGNKTNKIDYNGFEFVNQDGFWSLNLGNFDFVFRYNPNEVEKIDSEVNYLNSYFDKVPFKFRVVMQCDEANEGRGKLKNSTYIRAVSA